MDQKPLECASNAHLNNVDTPRYDPHDNARSLGLCYG